MNFYINIATVIIVTIICFLFRKIDTQNRNLETLRRYYEKIKDELCFIVDEKKQELADLTIEIGITEKAFKQQLDNYDKKLNDVRKRDKELEQMTRDLDEYHQAINEVSDVTAKANANLKLLEKKSQFMDVLKDDINTQNDNLEKLKKEIANIVGDFAVKNDASLEKLQIKYFNAVDEKINSIQNVLKQAGDKVEAFNKSMEELTNSQNQITEDAVNKLNEMLALRLDSMKDEVNRSTGEYIKELGVVLEDGQTFRDLAEKQINAALEVRLKDIDASVAVCQSDVSAGLEKLDGMKFEIESIDKKLQDLKAAGTEKLEDCLKFYDESFVREINDKKTQLTEAVESFSTQEKNISDLNEKLQNLDKAMEWIAKAETRITDKIADGDRMVALLGGLTENKPQTQETDDIEVVAEEKADFDVPKSENKTEMVVQLLKRGWDNKKIAQVLKISEGEVELIREFNL